MKKIIFILVPLCFVFQSRLLAQVVLDPPCAGTVTYLGQELIGLWGTDDPIPPNGNVGYLYEICPINTNYSTCNIPPFYCDPIPAPNCIKIGYSCGGLTCNDCDINNNGTVCIGSCTLTPGDISDTIILRNAHTIRFVQNNFNAGSFFQETIDLSTRCNSKDYGIKCKVAADGNQSTTLVVQGPNPSSIGIRPVGNTLDSIKNGYLHKYYISTNTESYAYWSPDGFLFPSDTIIEFQIFDTNCPDWVLATFKIKKYKVPVLLVHGLNSNGTIWDGFKNYLIDSGYSTSIISNENYPNDQSFSSAYPTINPKIQLLLNQYRSLGININQVDIIGHSMGGILGRYHLQSSDYINQQNINKLITVNTPHWGSEWANITLNPQYAPYINWLNNRYLGINLNGGAVEDLKVNSSAIAYMNSPQQLVNSKRAPIHTVTSDWTFCEYVPSDLSLAPLGKFIFQASWYYRFGRFTCWDICPPDCVLGVHNDGVVGVPSQKGGVNSGFVNFFGLNPDNSHIGTLGLDNEDIYEHLLYVLYSSTRNNYFTTSGFTYQPIPPPTLHQDSEEVESRSVVDVEISNLQSGDTIWTSLNPMIEVTGTPQVEGQMLFYIYNDGSFSVDSSFQNTNAYTIPIPAGYTGRLDIGVLGTDGAGNIDFDSVYIYISQTVLPLQFISFSAKEHEGSVNLVWEVEDVINVSKFIIEHSINGYHFVKLSEIKINHDDNSVQTYTYTHNQPINGENYYRIKYVDFDGTFSYSKINIINFINKRKSIKLLPNPTDGKIQIHTDQNVQASNSFVRIYDSLGRIMGSPLISNDLIIDISNHIPGIYTIEIEIGNEIQYFRIVKK